VPEKDVVKWLKRGWVRIEPVPEPEPSTPKKED
jgi:hypothetical protein